jgi:7-alpha-hydroxysteroid dehydrogenase
MNIIDSFRLDDRVAVVTGAGKGIGEGIAVGLAEAGADLALVARTRSDLERVAEKIRTLGRRALVVPCDVADVTAVPATVQKVAGNPWPTTTSRS